MKIMRKEILVLLASVSCVTGFTVGLSKYADRGSAYKFAMAAESEVVEGNTSEKVESISVEEQTNRLSIPLSFGEMVRQASSAMTDAYAQGVTRQIVRVLLPRDPENGQIGQFFEGSVGDDATRDLVLYPPDESWQGGIMQLYRSASPTCQEILREFSRNAAGGLPPRMVEDRSIDESGVDGVGVWITQGSQPEDDVSCFVQPTQEVIDTIQSISDQAGKRLVMLLNPQWRLVDDALDNASRNEGFMGNLASFLGGKGGSLKRLEDMQYQSTYTLEGYVCRGGNIRLIKRFDSNWAVFAENDAATGYIFVGTKETRPTYQDVDKMMSDKGISHKYARDVGLAPKL